MAGRNVIGPNSLAIFSSLCNAQRLTQSYTTTICRSSDNAQLLAIERFAPGPATGFDRRWAPSTGSNLRRVGSGCRRTGSAGTQGRRPFRLRGLNKRMLGFQGPAQPSPTLCDAINAGFGYPGSSTDLFAPKSNFRFTPKSDPSRTSREVRKCHTSGLVCCSTQLICRIASLAQARREAG